MPYPVPPPTPPPVVNLLPSEEVPSPAPLETGAVSRAELLGTPVEREVGSLPITPDSAAPQTLGIYPPDPSANWQFSTTKVPELGPNADQSADRLESEDDRTAEDDPASSPALQPRTSPETTDPFPEVEEVPSAEPSEPSETESPETEPSETAPSETAPTADDAPSQPETSPAEASPTESVPAPDALPDTVPIDPTGAGEIIELTADRQEYDEQRQIFQAEGNATMRFRNAVLQADRLQVNLPNRVAVAEGNVALTRGDQVLQGDRFEYNFVQEQGAIFGAYGQIFFPTISDDTGPALPTDITAGQPTSLPVGEQVAAQQPLQNVTGTPGLTVSAGGEADSGGSSGDSGDTSINAGIEGEINRLRFEAERIDFNADGWIANNVRLTNDPFSPPELEVRSPEVTFTRLSPTRSRIVTRRPRVVFDQGFSLPLLVEETIIDSRERNPGLVSFGFDEEDRDGFYVERGFDIISSEAVQFSVKPQILIQRAIDNGFFEPANLGLVAELNAQITPTTRFTVDADFSSLDFSEIEDNLRANISLEQGIVANHRLRLEYTYRDRLFNGSLGYEDVERSGGIVLLSPTYTLGNTGINLSYQASAQWIEARTDRRDLLLPPFEGPGPDFRRLPDTDDRNVELGRFQGSVALSRFFTLWTGTALPATPTEGLRYTPSPVVPYIGLSTGLTGTVGHYTSGDTQASLTGTVGLFAQFGNFSRPFFDYTALSLYYSGRLISGESPFRFDRVVDQNILSAGITQQIYGPFRAGVQTVLSLDDGDEIDTTFSLEYSRRTYSVLLSFSPIRERGSLSLRINDFNWTGDPGRFSGEDNDVQVIGRD